MFIGGLANLTLLDFPGKVACTVFTAGCNFRCPFCHNASLVYRSDELDYKTIDDIKKFLIKRSGVLEGVCITGGEPLIHNQTVELIKMCKDVGYKVKLDTNGTTPDKLISLIESELIDMAAIDIKNSPEKYGVTVGIPDFDIEPVRETVRYLLNSDFDYEFRTTVTADFHKADDFRKIGEWIKGCNKYYLQKFVDSGELIDGSIHGADDDTMREYLKIVQEYIPNAQLRGIN